MSELQQLVLENSVVRIVLLPEAGGKIWQITYKPLNADLLWNNPEIPPTRQPLDACYDDVWSGGWDELFPNDESGSWDGLDLPDHGELWTGAWHAEAVETNGMMGVTLRFETPRTNFLAEKMIQLRPDAAILDVRYALTNRSKRTLPFLWKLHPAFAVSGQHRIDFPAMTVVREPAFEGTLGGFPMEFTWPFAASDQATLDLRQVPGASSGALHFFYGTGLAEGWCGLTNRENRLAAALRFDPSVFSSCWLFASYGGWRDMNVAVLEPATGYPFNLRTMVESGRARTLAPGETLQTTVTFAMQEGLSSIGGVTQEGRILPGDED
ncbi:MAG TPA: hypothetical protein VG893_07500 [Terracidiphilus sp.]|nr:hypothetical protein [Terracidiphilus sp.]